jgi:hypothetical protein
MIEQARRSLILCAVIAAHLRHLHTGFLVAQDSDDLFFCEPASLRGAGARQ